MTRMTRYGILALSVCGAVAIGAASATGAGAAVPELGRCAHTKAHGGEKYKTRVSTLTRPGETVSSVLAPPTAVKRRFCASGSHSKL
jgi:hypothetical protein